MIRLKKRWGVSCERSHGEAASCRSKGKRNSCVGKSAAFFKEWVWDEMFFCGRYGNTIYKSQRSDYSNFAI